MKLKKKTIDLLLKVKERILTEPEKFEMAHWHDCNSAHCIGGWMGVLVGDSGADGWSALDSIGQTDSYDSFRLLFHPESWNRRFKRRYMRAKTANTRAKIAAERIDHFIATGGAE